MTVIGLDVLMAAGKKNVPLRKWLETWLGIARTSIWTSLDDVRKVYPTADGVRLVSKTVVTVFNVKGNNYRLLTWIDYDAQVVDVLDVLTHSEYDKNLWKLRY